MRATWKPHEKSGTLTKRADLPASVFAYPRERKEPMTNASHVRNAVARFDQVEGVSDDGRSLAFANIKKAARHYGVDLGEADWHELGSGPKKKTTRKKSAAPKKSAARKKTTTLKKSAGPKKSAARKKTAGRKKRTTRKKTTAGKKATIRR